MEPGELRSRQTYHCSFKSLDRQGGQSVKYARKIQVQSFIWGCDEFKITENAVADFPGSSL